MAEKNKPFSLDYDGIVAEVSKKFKLASGSMERKSIIDSTVPTGMLAVDLMLGGGVVGGRWYTAVGGEGAGKTTFKTHIELSAANHNIPILMDADYEGCFTEDTTIQIDGEAVSFKDLLKEYQVTRLTDDNGKHLAIQKSQRTLKVDTYGQSGIPATFKYGGFRRTTTLHLENGLTFEGAAHPIMSNILPVRNGDTSVFFGWVMIEQIQQGTYVLVKVGTQLPDGSVVEPKAGSSILVGCGNVDAIPHLEYVPVKVKRVSKNLHKHVWDVTLQGNLPKIKGAIITNGILTHNSNDPKYCEGMIEFWGGMNKTLEDVFGVLDDKGKVVIPPKLRYMTLDTAEAFFDGTASMLRRLPDKVFVEGKWWYAWDDSKVARAQSKGQHSAVMYSRYKRLMVEAEDGKPQGILFVDSYPMMFPETLNEDDAGSGMAAVARAMSANVPKIFSKLRRKNFSIFGINQLRQKPAVMYGCLHYDTPIHFVDGRCLPIGEVVKNKAKGKVWSWNEKAQKLEPREIIGWHDNGLIPQEQPSPWVQIVTYSETPGKFGSSAVVTYNHKVLTRDRGWVEALDLIPNEDYVLGRNPGHVLHPEASIWLKVQSVAQVDVPEEDRLNADRLTKWDISVEGNENYLAGSLIHGILVHNSPFYEPCGDTLKYASSCRVWLTPRAVPHGKGQVEKEPSVLFDNTEDTYRYVHMRTVKNKTFTPYQETWMRIWVDDGTGFAHGFDPVWDTYQFLLATGQLGVGSSLKKGLKLDKFIPELTKPVKWVDFKGLILLQGKELKEHCAKLGIKSNPKIREKCRKQIDDRSAFDMYFNTIADAAQAGASDDDDE